MLRISIVDTPTQRRLVVEGKLISPWTTELRTACDDAKADLKGRGLVVDLKNLTIISQEGEHLITEMMNENIKLQCCGPFTRLLLRRLSHRARASKKGAQ